MRKENKLKNTYLIQRLEKPYQININGKKYDNPFSFGGGLKNGGLSDKAMDILRDIFSFDYMGAAEFECGSVPEALSKIKECGLENDLKSGIIENNNEKIYYIAPKEFESEVIKRIKELRKDKIRLKEHCGLKEYFEPHPWGLSICKRIVGWLELNNGFMFFVDKDMWEKTCSIMFNK